MDSISQNIEMIEQIDARLDSAPEYLNACVNELVSFVSGFPYPAWIKDYTTRMIYINPSYERTFNVTVEEYNNRYDFEVWNNSHSNEYGANDRRVMESRQYIKTQEVYLDTNGVEHPVNILKWPLIHKGEVIGVAGIVEG